MPLIDITAQVIDIGALRAQMDVIRANIANRAETTNQADTFQACRLAEFDLRNSRTQFGVLYRGDRFVTNAEDKYKEQVTAECSVDLEEWPFNYIDWEAAVEDKLGEMNETSINDELYYYEG